MAQFEIYQLLLIWFSRIKEFIFEWDSGNDQKSLIKHNVSPQEAEEIFKERKFVVLGIQVSPVTKEERFGIIGHTKTGRELMVSFTLREGVVRIISARPMSRTERKKYDAERNHRV